MAPVARTSRVAGVLSSADSRIWNGAPLRICAYSLPVEPNDNTALWPLLCSNSAAIFCIGAVKFAATATLTSAARANPLTSVNMHTSITHRTMASPRYSVME